MSLSLTGVLRELGLRPAGGNFRQLRRWITEWEIATDHFDPDAGRRAGIARRGAPLEDYMVEHSTYSRATLKHRLFSEGYKTRCCELCGQGEQWRGTRMSLILDHINGVADDHRLENLQVVCPNCAATLPTHCGRNNRTATELPCARCGIVFRPRAKTQRFCSRDCGQRGADKRAGLPRPDQRKVPRPPLDELQADVQARGWSAVARTHGVSDNAVRKWVRNGLRARAQAAARPPGVPARADPSPPAPRTITTPDP